MGHKIKIHVAAPDISRASETIFGLGTDTIMKALQGDEDATRTLTDAANVTDQARRNIRPVLKQAQRVYQGTKDVNQAVLMMMKLAAKNGSQIVQMKGQGLVLNRRFVNSLEQTKAKVAHDLTEEQIQHQQSLNLLRAKHKINTGLMNLSYQERLNQLGEGAQDRINAMQVNANQTYQQRRLRAIQQDGSKAELHRIPQRTISGSTVPTARGMRIGSATQRLFRGVKNFFGSLIRTL